MYEGNLKRFLAYAIGKIFLVVIGILIALQINNWNQSRKIERLRSAYVKNLTIDLNRDYAIIEELNELN